MGVTLRETFRHIVALESRVVRLVVLPGVGDVVVGLESLGVDTPFCVDIDYRLAALCLFGGNHNDTIGSTCSVEGV